MNRNKPDTYPMMKWAFPRFRKMLLTLGVLAFFAVGMLTRCARPVMPQGGPRDTIPPKVVAISPPSGTVNFDEKRIYIEFDEFVQLKDQQKEFYTSPFMTRNPSLSIRGRGIQIDIQDTLLENQTYSLNFGASIADNNEGNPYVGLRYVFSTGEEIDSLLMSGYTVDAYKTDTVGNVYILFYDPLADSLPGVDSVVFKANPLAVARSYPNGIFIAENLKPMDYLVYALEDNNSNRQYEAGVDRIAFLDTLYNPIDMPPFDIWYDTVRQYLQADPQVLVRLFMEKPFKRQMYSTSSRSRRNLIELYFGAPFPQIDEFVLDDIDSTRIITEYLTENRDSMYLWINTYEFELPDTIKGHIIYQKHDSIFQYERDTVQLRLGWREPEISRSESRNRRQQEEEEEDPRVPLQVSVSPRDMINPEVNLSFKFNAPLILVDTARIELDLIHENGRDTLPRTFNFRQDTLKLREWNFSSDWKPDEKYRLLIPEGTFMDVNGQYNDSLRAEFTIDSPDKYGTLIFNVKGKTDSSQYILDLLDERGTILQQKTHISNGKVTFRYVPPGEVRLRVTEDDNGNGRWDTGSVTERRQPERVEMFINTDGKEIMTARANWELDFDVDMSRIFVPVTMERMQEMIRRNDEIMLKKRAEALEEYRKRYPKGRP